jgi:flagellar biosynthetic protein FlhB
MNQKRIVQEVPKATVVITNPTHFAVALKYDLSVSKAPIVVAKGADHLAKKIIRIARENGVAVVERKPVARFLYANVKVGKEIPLQLYQAVAEILNYVRRFGASP